MIALVLAAVAASYITAMPGEVFPDFDIEEHCNVTASSTNPKIAYMAKNCRTSENEYRQMAQRAWPNAERAHRTVCDVQALSAIGSYQVLASCLNNEFVKSVLLRPKGKR